MTPLSAPSPVYRAAMQDFDSSDVARLRAGLAAGEGRHADQQQQAERDTGMGKHSHLHFQYGLRGAPKERAGYFRLTPLNSWVLNGLCL